MFSSVFVTTKINVNIHLSNKSFNLEIYAEFKMGHLLFEKAYLINDFILRHKIVSIILKFYFNTQHFKDLFQTLFFNI